MNRSQGGKANDHGYNNRGAIIALLLSHGYTEVGPISCEPKRSNPFDLFDRAVRGHIEQPTKAFAAEVPVCYSLHDHIYKVDVLTWRQGWPEHLAIMGRTQNSPGSALEKLYFMYDNLVERVPCRSMVVLDGEAYTSAVFRCADERSIRSKGHIAKVFNGLSEFRHWLTEGAPWPKTPEQLLLTEVG